MADRRFKLSVDNNLKEILNTLGAIHKSMDALTSKKKKKVDLDKKEVEIEKEKKDLVIDELKATQALLEKKKQELELEKELANLKAKAQGYRDAADSMKKKFSLSDLIASFGNRAKGKISGKYDSLKDAAKNQNLNEIANLNNQEAAELSALKGDKRTKAYKDAVKGIKDRYSGLRSDKDTKLKNTLAKYDSEEERDLAKQDLKTAAISTIVQSAVNMAKKIIKIFGAFSDQILHISLSIKDAWNDILKITGEMTDMYKGMATYATGASLIMNSQARTTQMKYGLSDAQTYAFTQTSQMLGIGLNNDEDLMYMNQSQRQMFTQYMQKYSSWYEQLMSSGALQDIQKMQLEFAMFKQEVAVELLQFVADNKDTLLAAAKGIMSILEWVMKIGTNLLGGIFGGGNSSTSNTANNVTIKVDYIDGGSGSSQMGSFVSDLSRQINTALGG